MMKAQNYISLAFVVALTFDGISGITIVKVPPLGLQVVFFCVHEINPLCGSDGKTYTNVCELTVASLVNSSLKINHNGECSCYQGVCPEYEPICGSDGITYSNRCELKQGQCKNQHLTEEHQGVCDVENPKPQVFQPLHIDSQADITCGHHEKKGLCSDIYSPVCANDGKTYPNKCMLCFAMYRDGNLKLEHDGKCVEIIAEVTTPRVINIECDDNVKYCGKEYRPVCANDGTTLANECVFCLYKMSRERVGVRVDLSHGGECSPEEYCTPTGVHGACPYTYFPLCASDSKTYPNLCVMCAEMYKQRAHYSEYALRKVHDGVCRFKPPMDYEEQFCSELMKDESCSIKEYWPYCASDGKTYGSKCLFCKEMYKQKEKGVELIVNVVGECPGNFQCSPESRLNQCSNTDDEPVCGSDGATYKNNCVRCAEMYRRQEQGENIFIYVKYKGVCLE